MTKLRFMAAVIGTLTTLATVSAAQAGWVYQPVCGWAFNGFGWVYICY